MRRSRSPKPSRRTGTIAGMGLCTCAVLLMISGSVDVAAAVVIGTVGIVVLGNRPDASDPEVAPDPKDER